MSKTAVSIWAVGLGVLSRDVAAYPTQGYFSCGDSRTIGISSSSKFMVCLEDFTSHLPRSFRSSRQTHSLVTPALVSFISYPVPFLMQGNSQSADASMSLVITGSLSGPIVSGTGSTSGTYTAGETLTVSKSGGSGQYMYEADINGMGSCSFST